MVYVRCSFYVKIEERTNNIMNSQCLFRGGVMNLRKRDFIIILIATIVLSVSGTIIGTKLFQHFEGGQTTSPITFTQQPSNAFEKELNKVRIAYDLINRHYFEEVDKDELLEGAIQGMLETLNDPYSSYMNEEAMKRFNEQIQSSFQGIGAEVSMIDGKVTIIAPIKGSPAEKAGLRPNDQILKVDNESLDGLDINQAVEKIRGEKGSEVVLLVQRQGASEPFEVKIIRDDIPLITVESTLEKVNGKNTGIIHIRSFSETTDEEFNDALTELEAEGIDGLVIDVRGNPGGLLHSIEEILKHFITKDMPYLQTEDRDGNREKFYTKLTDKKPYPISVVIDEGSASASEILAVAMKEAGYNVVGTTSFGKGTVQQALPLTEDRDGSTIKLTFYKWLSPKGNWIHEIGVEPTVEQKQPDFYYANPIIVEEPFKYNQADEQIKNAQILLKGIGYDPKREDGYFDDETKRMIEKFQQDHQLSVTGELDNETAQKIETEVMELIRSGEQDLQLKKAMEVLY